MTETESCIQKLHWLFDKQKHEMQVEGISQYCDEIIVKLSDPSKNFKITRFLGINDLLEQVCQGVEDASRWS